MQIHYSMEHLPDIDFPAVTVGSFDGVHAGHRVIIDRLNHLARKAGGESVLITFHPHPRIVLYPDTAGKDLKLITTPPEKSALLEEAGLDHLIIMEFTRDFSRTTSTEFVRDYLVGRLHAHIIVVGFNHYFGYNKEGSYESLYRMEEQYGFRVEEIPEQEIQHETVSSTKIRKALGEGNVQRANAYLEYHFRIRARIKPVPSPFPQLNEHGSFQLQVTDSLKLVPPDGRYAVSVGYNGSLQKGMVWISGGIVWLFLPESRSGCGADDGGEERWVLFHKHLGRCNGQWESGWNLQRDMETVRELIY